jgi:SpoVK/Ycf46/Vps4 family AAA+-type ATPase
MEFYKNSLEHLIDELGRIELKVRLQILKFRMTGRGGPDEFSALCITEEQIDSILAQGDRVETQRPIESSQIKNIRDQLACLEAGISEKKVRSIREGILLRLERLKELFQLSAFDVDVLLAGLAPEVDLKYEKLYGYLQDNLSRKRPSIDLILELLCSSFEQKLESRRYFTSTAPLIRFHVVNLFADGTERNSPFFALHLNVDERITNYVFGSDQMDARLVSFARWVEPGVSWADVVLPEGMKVRLGELIEGYSKSARYEGLTLYFQGTAGTGKRTAAEALCSKLGIRLLVVDAERLMNGDLGIEMAARLLFREALLQQAALYVDNFDSLLGEEAKIRQCREILIQELEDSPVLTFLGGSKGWESAGLFHRRNFIRVDFAVPPYALRKELWKSSLEGLASSTVDVDAVANRFRLSPGQIRNAVVIARNFAVWRDPANGSFTSDDLHDACRAQSNHKLGSLAQKIIPRYTWSDIVLGKEQTTQLREILNYVRYRQTVYGEWGFDEKLAVGRGVNILFAGPSGTGKTMAAGILARELELDLYKIDLSSVVSKYIGETEKNLSRIFQEAQNSDSILFFDEADALFGKRSEVKDAHDRYANIEIAYLLQRMEEYDGVVILATNLRNNMDDAFTRRMHATIDFSFPEENYRRRIFESIFPKRAPLSPEIDFAFLARQFKLTGGNIKNVVLHAAFLAAENGNVIGMQQLVRATKREFQKMGKVCSKADFGPYYEMMKEE